MRLCMFHPNDNPMERGWVGRIDGDRVLHLAAQTLQSLFLGGGGAREHAEYALADVTLLVPVQYPPTVRIFEEDGSFAFANATAVVGPNVPVEGGALSAFAGRRRDRRGRRDRRLLGHGPVAGPAGAARREDVGLRHRARAGRRHARRARPGRSRLPLEGGGFESAGQRRTLLAGPRRSRLPGAARCCGPGDVLAGPPVVVLDDVGGGVQLEVEGIGTLALPSPLMRLVLDWDGTVTERDTLHLAIERFGDLTCSARWRRRSDAS